MVEQLVAAAIRRNGEVKSSKQGHSQVRCYFDDKDPYTKKRGDEEGFLTSNGRFVDRDEAQDVAVKSGQLRERQRRELLSSDVVFP